MGIELAKVFGRVECFDYSHPFVGMMRAKIEEGGLGARVVGYQADAHNLVASVRQPDPLGKFDLVFNCNLIDRLHSPQEFVTQVWGICWVLPKIVVHFVI